MDIERATGAERNWRRATGAIDCVNLFKPNMSVIVYFMDLDFQIEKGA